MARLVDGEKRLGPLTYGKCVGWAPWRLVLSSGDDDEDKGNTLTGHALGWVWRVNLPSIIQPHRKMVTASSWSAETIARMGRNWYYDTHARKYGFSLCDGFLQLFLGVQTHDSSTTQSWSCHLPWTQWRHVRYSMYAPDGSLYWSEDDEGPKLGQDWRARFDAAELCPKATFLVEDFDGAQITATCKIEQREWLFGTGWFKWLSLFVKRKVRRSLDISFSAQVGPEKGSWKGGMTGHGIEMLPGESCEQAFRRYCDLEQRSKYRTFRIKFVGPA